MSEHITTVQIYYGPETIGSAEITFHTDVKDKDGHMYEYAWVLSNIQIQGAHKETLDELHYRVYAVLDIINKVGVALTLGDPKRDLCTSSFMIHHTQLVESDISKITYIGEIPVKEPPSEIELIREALNMLANEIVHMQRTDGRTWSEHTNEFLFKYNKLIGKE
ncbi:MAG: hypothetical protein US61_C0042G0004 [Parcubacteria group bacterium GW2011_GWE2_37_8]|nr:MAG: hypothetical protein US61_C0042G0004 [Parcubacteria group bacterium GW2011_GWE2_37_8]